MKKITLFLLFSLYAYISYAQTATTVVSLIDQPDAIALTGTDLYVANFFEDKISKIDLSATTPTATTFLPNIQKPLGLVISGTTMYVINEDINNFTKKISRVDLNTSTVTDFLTTGLSFPEAMVLNGTDLYVADVNKILKIDVNSPTPTPTVFLNLDRPYGLVFNGNDLYYSEFNINAVYKIDVTNPTATPTLVANGFNRPVSLEIRGDELYVAERDAYKITKIDLTATLPATPTTAVTGVVSPMSIEINNNTLYIAEGSPGDKISKFNLPVTHTFTNGAGGFAFETPGNWNTGLVPSDNDNIIVPNTLFVSVNSNVTLNNITLHGQIQLNTSLTVAPSFIVNGTITGSGLFETLQLEDSVPTDEKWHLVSAPLSGMSFLPADLNDPTLHQILATNATGDIALGEYTNTPDSDGSWSYPYNNSDFNSYTFGTAKGYAVKYIQNPSGSFVSTRKIGTYPTLPVTAPLTIGQSGDADTTNDNPWNLVGNPFPSRVDIAQFLTDNAGVLKDTHQAVYIWNPSEGAAGEYQQLTTGVLEIGQGFFVSAKNATGDNVTFSAASRTHTSGTFYRNSAPNIKLLANDAHTQINFSETATNGLDPRFDIGTFGGAASGFKLFTELVANNEGVSFMQQTLPTSSLEEGVIPVGLTTNETKDVAFKIEAANLPQGAYVYLEDKQTGTFTNLVETSYKVTVNANEASTGRFYVHTSAKALSTEAVSQDLANVSIFKSDAQTVSITGLQADKAMVNVYSVLGKEVYTTNVTPNGLTKVNLPNLATGVYVVNVTSELGKVSKKIVIE